MHLRVKIYAGKELETLLEGSENVGTCESNKLSGGRRKILQIRSGVKSVDIVDHDEEYCRRVFNKPGLAMTSDGANARLINLEGHAEGNNTSALMEVESTPEPLDGLLSTPPAPADEKYLPGSSVENEDMKPLRYCYWTLHRCICPLARRPRRP